MTSDRRSMPRSLLLLGVAAAMATWASAGAATAQDKSAPAKQDATARQATNAKQDAAGAARSRRISQPPKFSSTKGQPARPVKRGVKPKGAGAAPKPTVVLKAGEVPDISFDTPSYNFGRVRAGQPVKHDFWFTNTGTGPLEITRVKPS